MTDKMTAERLAEIREGLSAFDGRRLETSMSGGVDTPGRVTYHFGPSQDGLPRYGIVGMLPEIAAELMAEVERLRDHCADLILSLTYSDHELEEHAVPEVERLREQVKTLQAERDDMTEEWARKRPDGLVSTGDRAGHRFKSRFDAEQSCFPGESVVRRLVTPWLPADEEGTTHITNKYGLLGGLLDDMVYKDHAARPKRVVAKLFLAYLDGQVLDGYDAINTGEAQYGSLADRLIKYADSLLTERTAGHCSD